MRVQQAAVAPAPTAVQEEKKEESRRSPEIVDKSKHGVAAAADARAKEVDTAAQYEAKLQLMEEVVEYKERELWNMRREAEKRTGLNIDDCSVEELEELESELLKALVRIKTVKKKKAKEVRDSIKMDLLQVRTPSRPVCVCVVAVPTHTPLARGSWTCVGRASSTRGESCSSPAVTSRCASTVPRRRASATAATDPSSAALKSARPRRTTAFLVHKSAVRACVRHTPSARVVLCVASRPCAPMGEDTETYRLLRLGALPNL